MRHWSQSNGTLDSQGNRITQNGGIFNINTGEYKEPAKKVKQEWEDTRKTLKKSSGIKFH